MMIKGISIPFSFIHLVAIGVLEGTYPPEKEEDTTTKAQFKIEKSVISPASRRFVGGGGLKIK